ncbi:uncharacterized protein LOC121589563 isoform X2 [Anopheles merus]|uniref:uncharacterized protein LOC121589563 isoform X2 n=1 Tax=Anopheles merus TaxID=30066 RepID=UPI001BE46533|nr:uncharacterized protein LOC121589563 isoform X2 [Anopheles merus]
MVRCVLLFAVLVALALPLMSSVRAICTASVSADRVAACAFNPLLLLVERSGWVLSRQNCGETIGPEAFTVPPVLYYDYTEPDHLYTVVFVATESGHPDPFDGGEPRFYLQWLVVNVPTFVADALTIQELRAQIAQQRIQQRYGVTVATTSAATTSAATTSEATTTTAASTTQASDSSNTTTTAEATTTTEAQTTSSSDNSTTTEAAATTTAASETTADASSTGTTSVEAGLRAQYRDQVRQQAIERALARAAAFG